ncbi:anti-sigma factor [Nocardioides marmoriginsengisoli]|uniref:Regulator of SigK n=1 Tax=Nocardioides marmoriginsengisoli TaxID=661483 RepID=A0A3N0CP29_9ACTN|nr:anti-sigma factor [Nocardioides marmoriginsengisoli]RNL65224.1 anti-sigma factor [Nocardioides marmoriginsengisoli]
MTAHEIHALAGAYAVDALDDVERARFEEHLAVCAECRAEVASLADATLLLSEVTAVAPPASMRGAILADIKKVRPLPPAVARIEKRRPRRWTGLVAAAVALGVLGGGSYVVLQIQDDSSEVGLTAADRVLRASDVQHVTADLARGGVATVFHSAKQGKAVVVTEGLPPAPSGHVYQLWLRKASGMVPAGFITGTGEQTELFEGGLAGASGAGITIEPDGGSKVPTLPVVALVDFEPDAT